MALPRSFLFPFTDNKCSSCRISDHFLFSLPSELVVKLLRKVSIMIRPSATIFLTFVLIEKDAPPRWGITERHPFLWANATRIMANRTELVWGPCAPSFPPSLAPLCRGQAVQPWPTALILTQQPCTLYGPMTAPTKHTTCLIILGSQPAARWQFLSNYFLYKNLLIHWNEPICQHKWEFSWACDRFRLKCGFYPKL